MVNADAIALCQYRLSKAESFLHDAEETLKLEMYENAANRSYYAIFHNIRALLALDGVDFSKHAGVISYFQLNYIKNRKVVLFQTKGVKLFVICETDLTLDPMVFLRSLLVT